MFINGYYNGEVDGTNNETTREALSRFQQENGIESDGAARPRTLQKLRDTQQKKQSGEPAPERPLLRGRR
jgi:peptidoglycan hydrolase-like protein with peptidoglycan-binding domain